jgi:hypothetical protein
VSSPLSVRRMVPVTPMMSPLSVHAFKFLKASASAALSWVEGEGGQILRLKAQQA